MDSGEIRDLLPDWIGGRLEPSLAGEMERAVALDEDLQAEAALLRSLAAGREPVPAGLDTRITARVIRERHAPAGRVLAPARHFRASRRWWTQKWVVAAAAMLVLALGTFEVADRVGLGRSTDVDALSAALESAGTPWMADDGTVAGAPVLDGLSDEALASLLEELGG